ncbi:MAG: DnaJ family domain-containing protein [Planctomycetota bacterium]|jgi:hypothetical protein
MPEKKPPGVSYETWIDRQIRDAQARGEFDNLPGAGKPIPGLDKPYDELWWLKQMLVRENLDATPEFFKLKKVVEEARKRIPELPSEMAVRRLIEDLNARIDRANAEAVSGPPSDLVPLDVERAVERWRAARDKREASRPDK